MTQESTAEHPEARASSSAHFVHAVLQFALAVRHRKSMVVVALVVTSLLGGLYYLTATRRYFAGASVLVLDVGSTPTKDSAASLDASQETLLPNFQRVIESEKVVKRALAQLRPEECVDFKGKPRSEWLATLQKYLSVGTSRKSTILEVSYTSKDPHAAVAVVNAIVESYQAQMDEIYKGNAHQDIEVLSRKERELHDRLNVCYAQRERLSQLARDPRATPDSEIVHPLVERALAINKELTEAGKRRQNLEISSDRIRAAVHRGGDLGPHIVDLQEVLGVQLEALLGLTSSGDLQANLQQSVIEDQALLEQMRAHYGPAHPKICDLLGKIELTERSLLEYPKWIREKLTSDMGPELIAIVENKLIQVRQYEASLAREFNRAEQDAMTVNRQLAELQQVDDEIDYLNRTREELLSQIENRSLRHDGQELRATVINDPTVDENPVSPSLVRTALMVLLLGLGSGLAAVYVSDTLSDRFRSMDEMQALVGVPALAIVAELPTEGATGIEALQAYSAPNAVESEAFRTLRTALSFAEQETRQLVISSPEPGDGKTTVLANLGVAIAQSGKRVLLIDADLRRPGLTAMLGMRGIDGLSSVIRSDQDLVAMAKAQTRASEIEGLDVMPSGPRPPNPAELLGSQRFSELLAWAESCYDQVLVDSPPTLATCDAAVVGRLVEGALLVVNPAKNRRRAVMRSVESFALMKIPLVGIVVNRISSTKDGYYGYDSHYGYQYAYGNETEEPDLAAAVIEDDGFAMDRAAHARPDDSSPLGRIVPRRVA